MNFLLDISYLIFALAFYFGVMFLMVSLLLQYTLGLGLLLFFVLDDKCTKEILWITLVPWVPLYFIIKGAIEELKEKRELKKMQGM